MASLWHLLIDVDAHMGAPLSNDILKNRLWRASYRIDRIERVRSPSGRGWHIKIRLDREPSSPMETVALQCICGSDPLRESSNILRARNVGNVDPFWQPRWNVLYERREA
jgi:hypothetical protein